MQPGLVVAAVSAATAPSELCSCVGIVPDSQIRGGGMGTEGHLIGYLLKKSGNHMERQGASKSSLRLRFVVP